MESIELAANAAVTNRAGGLAWLRQRGLAANAEAHLGDIDEALEIVHDTKRRYPGTAPLHPFAAAISYAMAQRAGDLVSMRAVLLEALSEREILDDAICFNATLSMLLTTAHLRWDPTWWLEAIEIGRQHRQLVDSVNGFIIGSIDQNLGESYPARLQRHQNLEAAIRGAPPWHLTTLMVAAEHTVWLPGEAQFVNRILADAMPTVGIVSMMTANQAIAARQSGDWAMAVGAAERGIAAASSAGLHYWKARLQGHLAVTRALLGDAPAATELARDATRWATSRGTRIILDDARHAETILALSRGDYEAGYASLTGLTEDLDRWMMSAYGMTEALDLAESCHHTGRPGDARKIIETAMGIGRQYLSPKSRMLLCAASAVVEEDVRASDRLFREALASDAMLDFPYEAARVRLAYADHLAERGEDTLGAMAQRRRAVELFETLGAVLWAERAREMLGTAPSPEMRKVDPRLEVRLSPQELHVALLAAQGLSNKQIGADLFISARTVGFHLYNAFPKLGISSRAGLRDALLVRGVGTHAAARLT